MERMKNLNGDLNHTILVLRQALAAAVTMENGVSSSDRSDIQRLQGENEALRAQALEANSSRIKTLEQQVEETEAVSEKYKKRTKRMRGKFCYMRKKFLASLILQSEHKARFLNFLQENGFVSNPDAAEACIDAWMYALGLNPDEVSMDRWERSRGFSVMPGLVDSSAKPFEMSNVDLNTAKESFAVMLERVLVPSEPNPYADVDEYLTGESSADKSSEGEILEDGSDGIASQDPEQLEGWKDNTPSDSKNPSPEEFVEADKTATEKSTLTKTDGESRKHSRSEIMTDDASSGVTKKSRITKRKVLESDDEDSDPQEIQGRTSNNKMQGIRGLYDDVLGQQPWKRVLWSESFLPEVTDEPPVNPRHRQSVKLFHDALRNFWWVAGQTIWMRLFQVEHSTKCSR
ncbi:hypothetical protein LEN26_012193 [Aphanomyces euteiches]|nr:hypothetical protein LEN26_012193 [Aphanomyces euteiches]